MIECLNTGDIAYFDEDGDYFIVGRVKRFIKLYGLRFSLDQLEMHLLNLGFQAVCGGKDDNLKVAVVDLKDNDYAIKTTLVDDYKINVKSIKVFKIDEISRTSSGKIDYKNIFR
jgi:long-chain acyl-CoA synthetase